MTRRPFGVALAVISFALAAAAAQTTPARGGAVATPSSLPSGQTPPPLDATATPRPGGTVVSWTGQILDDRAGYVFFTTGDGFRLDQAVKVVDARTGGPTTLVPETRTYARADFDAASGRVVALALSAKKLPDEATYDAVKRFAVALSTPAPNPDLGHPSQSFNGRIVLVTFTVEVPTATQFRDPVYLATDVSGWSATAIRMDRVDALHYRVSRDFASGTKLLYRYTRGSWRSAERDQRGLEPKPHELVVENADVRVVRDTVYSWGDGDPNSPNLGPSLPTPFNPVPFNLPPPARRR